MKTALPLQDMIANVIKTANTKLAADKESEKAKNLLSYEKKEHGHIPSPKEEEEECPKTAHQVDSDYVEKLASAVDYIASHLDEIEAPGPIAQAMSKLAMKPGAGGGSAGGKAEPAAQNAGALPVSQAVGGNQSYKKNTAKGDQAEDEGKRPLSNARKGDGKTQLDNDMHAAPGNNKGSVPKTTYPAKGPLVAGPSAKTHSAPNAASFGKHAGASEVLARVGQHSLGGAAGAALGAGIPAMQKAQQRMKLANAEAARHHILMKLAGEDVMKANIDGGGTVSAQAGKGQLRSMKSGDEAPHQAGDATNSQDGNAARRLIASNDAAINATKRDAKKPVVAPLGEVLDQPALSPKHDTKLQENLRNTGNAGVKIAAVRQSLQKIASAGCICNERGECQYCLMSTKLANMGMVPDGGNVIPPAPDARTQKLQAAMDLAKGRTGVEDTSISTNATGV